MKLSFAQCLCLLAALDAPLAQARAIITPKAVTSAEQMEERSPVYKVPGGEAAKDLYRPIAGTGKRDTEVIENRSPVYKVPGGETAKDLYRPIAGTGKRDAEE